jgi:hypothetical protein
MRKKTLYISAFIIVILVGGIIAYAATRPPLPQYATCEVGENTCLFYKAIYLERAYEDKGAITDEVWIEINVRSVHLCSHISSDTKKQLCFELISGRSMPELMEEACNRIQEFFEAYSTEYCLNNIFLNGR